MPKTHRKVAKDAECNPFAKANRYLCGMNKAIQTFRCAFAVVLVLLLTLVPHHHHMGGAACWVDEVCHEDGRHNDEHTAHGEAHHAASHDCFWKAPSADNAAVRQQADDGSWPLLSFLPHRLGENLLPDCPERDVRSPYYNVSYGLLLRSANPVWRRGPPTLIG